MPERADAHIHLFADGYQGDSFTRRPGVNIDETACYDSLAQEHGIRAALVVGYEGEPWAHANNEHIARLRQHHDWVHPLAYVAPQHPLTIRELDALQRRRFVGLSFYLFSESDTQALQAIPDDFWRWLAERGWLISVNSRGTHWQAWTPILDRHPALRLLIAHLGLPAQLPASPADASRHAELASVLGLASFPQVHVKLSGFYALAEPSHDYPHTAAWPWVQAVVQAFGVERCLWGSDFSPHLDHVSFPQTLGLFQHMPFLTENDRQRIEGASLLALLSQVEQ